jgi:predicted phage-related endonuclease
MATATTRLIDAEFTNFVPKLHVFKTREEWLAGRRIGASSAAAILGCGYAGQTKMTEYERLVNGTIIPPTAEQIKKFAVGLRIEPMLRDLFFDETGIVCKAPAPFSFYSHPQYPWLTASLDGECDEFGIPFVIPAELKFVTYFAGREWLNDKLPLKFEIQTNHQMLVTGAPHAYLFGLVDGLPQIRKVERNDDFCEVLLIHLKSFWKCVESRTPPEPDGLDGTGAALGRIYNSYRNGATVDLPDEANEWSARLEAAKEKIKAAEADKELFANKIKSAIGDAEFGKTPDGNEYSWKTQNKKEFTVKASTSRVLRKCG